VKLDELNLNMACALAPKSILDATRFRMVAAARDFTLSLPSNCSAHGELENCNKIALGACVRDDHT
jgi:hypothetical protein